MPLGGSTVILEPFWRMKTGNLGLGMLVSHSRKSRCTWNRAIGHSFIKLSVINAATKETYLS